MKTAVLISGQARTFDRCYPSQHWQVFRHYEPDIHFFVSVKNDSDAPNMEVLREHYKNVHIEFTEDPPEGELWMPPERSGDHAPYANAASHRALMLQHWGNCRVFQFFNQRREGSILDFQTIIRIRPDLYFHRFIPPRNPIPVECYCPWWGRFGGINDRFAIMGIHAAEWYFEVSHRIEEYLKKGCPFHPETLVRESLVSGRIVVLNTLQCWFSTLRISGQQRWPEVEACDIAELISQYGQ